MVPIQRSCVCLSVSGPEDPPLAVFEQRQPVVGPGPYSFAVHADGVNAIVGQAVSRREVLPPVSRQVLRQERCSGEEYGEKRDRLHRAFKYSMRSFSSSLERSFVTPCLSFGLNT